MLRMSLVAGFVLAFSLACAGGGESGPPHAPFEGEWQVKNADGDKTGQIIDFQEGEITLTTLGRPSTDKATYVQKGDAVEVDYIGWKYTLKMGEDDKHASFKGNDGGGVQYDLVRD